MAVEKRTSGTPSPSVLVALALLLALLWFGGLGLRALQHPDEGRYAEIAREMLASGDFVTPRLNGFKYFEKPPLQYWTTAAAYQALGVSAWTARLWPALTSLATILFVGWVGGRCGGRNLGVYAATVLAGTLGYVVASQVLTLDAGLTAFLTVAFGAFVVAQSDACTAAQRRRWMVLAWAAMAAGTLSKGPIALVIPLGALGTYSLLGRDWGPWRRLHARAGLAVFGVITIPWFVLVARANGEFLRFFFVHEHLTRFLTSEHHRGKAWWYFVPVFLAGSLPWITPVSWRCVALWREAPRNVNGFSWPRFALAWAAFVFVFFSASGSKLATYILPMLPPLALVAGRMLEGTEPRALSRSIYPLLIVSLLMLLLAWVPWRSVIEPLVRDRSVLEPLREYRWWLACSFAFVAVGCVAAMTWANRGEPGRFAAVLCLTGATLAGGLVGIAGFDEFSGARSSRDLLAAAERREGPLRPDVPFYQVALYDQTLPFYLGRTTVLVNYQDEFSLGIEAEPQRRIATVDLWQRQWADATSGYALVDADTFGRLTRGGMAMRVLAAAGGRLLVARH